VLRGLEENVMWGQPPTAVLWAESPMPHPFQTDAGIKNESSRSTGGCHHIRSGRSRHFFFIETHEAPRKASHHAHCEIMWGSLQYLGYSILSLTAYRRDRPFVGSSAPPWWMLCGNYPRMVPAQRRGSNRP
jgi:hypothetical protein